ncbi:hypothetical protein C8Q75DRAFT_801562 [Abortiporus biennis]|nr:hypothetical protein C8Q75DRAFT_801562 [Abortiporus biennis]
MSAYHDTDQDPSGSSLHAAVARTATRSIALYFSRPVRLFRPSKVNGWQILKVLATHHGKPFSPRYISWLVKKQGFMVIPKHFLPPMAVNILIGSVLWTSYGEASEYLADHISSPLCVAALSGGIAGGMQALVAAPAENVRFALEGGTSATGWSHAWKEVFRGTNYRTAESRDAQLHEAREVRQWMKEVGEMAGRGWDGWGWGFAKDVCGFALFFSIFELTRRIATRGKTYTENLAFLQKDEGTLRVSHAPRIVHAITLVAGGAGAGLAYEIACRPWDIARKTVHIDRITSANEKHSIVTILMRKLRDEGMRSFFANPVGHVATDTSSSPLRRRVNSMLRTVARVGPWGVGFLMWEVFGPGIS